MAEQANRLLGDQASVAHIMPQGSEVHFRCWPGSSKGRGLGSCIELVSQYYYYKRVPLAGLPVLLSNPYRLVNGNISVKFSLLTKTPTYFYTNVLDAT